MPEGDTLHNLARRLSPSLMDATITAARNREQGELRPAVGERVMDVRALGKHLIVALSGGWSLRAHLGIGGRCDLYEKGQRWRGRASTATMVLSTETHEVVFFRAPQGRLVRTAHLRAEPALRLLGPDLLAPEVDMEVVLARLRKPRRADIPIGVALLDQRVAAGIGNVYKCEVLFLGRVDPWAEVRQLDDATAIGLYGRARELMQANLSDGPRVTVPVDVQRRGARHWVYGRTGEPCLRCGTRIASERQGDQARTTHWCPGCQPNLPRHRHRPGHGM